LKQRLIESEHRLAEEERASVNLKLRLAEPYGRVFGW
jgi:hypothetical protein